MIITNLTGGLGNQLFQYSLGKKLSLQNNSSLKFNISSFKTNQARNFKLDVFDIEKNIANEQEINYFIKNNKLQKKIFFYLQKIKPYKHKKYYQEKSFEYDKNIEKLKSTNLYIQGYWQSEKYFKNIRKLLLKEIKLNNQFYEKYSALLKKIKENNSISIHFRKTDYIKGKHAKTYHNLSEKYYQSAIKIIKNKIKNPIFFIFSDDIEWVKKNAKLPPSTIFISNQKTKDYEELILMSKCKHNIIANSSFSWWGAWLNQNPKKIIISPQNWFTNKNIKTKDLIPQSWIKI